MFKQAPILVWTMLLAIATVHADEKKTFMVQDGAFPWYDRVNNWALADVPESLKGSGPLPQQSCSSRGLEISDNPKVVTIGIAKTDLAKFKQKFPAVTETGDAIAVRNAGGAKLAYVVATLADPPAKIEGAGVFDAGLLLLKVDGTTAIPVAAERPAPVKPATAPPAQPAPPAPDAGDKTFVVQDGAFPWHDRATGTNTWALANVPESLKGSGPLPQQNCSSRALDTPGTPKAISIGVSEGDMAKFKIMYPNATETGEGIVVKNPQGAGIPYRVVAFPNPPAKIGAGAGFGAGLLLLKIGDTPAASAASTTHPTAPAAPKATSSTNTASSAITIPAVAPAPPTTPSVVVPPAIPAPAVATPVGVAQPAKESFHIYLLMGQSNMVGRDTGTIASQVDNPRILALDGNGRWIVAREPMHVGGTGVGPGISFALTILKADPKMTIGLVPCAVGGTPLSRWVKGADLYEKAVSRAKAAAQVGVIKGALWHQGESDTGKQEDAESYETRLTQMFTDLRTDLGLPNLPIVVGQLGDFLTPARYPYVETVRGAIEHIPVVVPHVGYADATGLGDKGDKLHFSADAQKEFGARYAAVMLKLQEPPKPTTPIKPPTPVKAPKTMPKPKPGK